MAVHGVPRGQVFGPRERREVLRAARFAESVTGRFYCIPGREWLRYPYEIRTLAEGDGPPPAALAEVVRLVAVSPGPRVAVRDLWRIRLRDDAILSAVRDREDPLDLRALLAYVLTHELVHVIRFGSGAARFHDPPPARLAEEARVRSVTRRILQPIAEPALARVFRLYCDPPEDAEVGGRVSPK